jgi:hypothetical protein
MACAAWESGGPNNDRKNSGSSLRMCRPYRNSSAQWPALNLSLGLNIAAPLSHQQSEIVSAMKEMRRLLCKTAQYWCH